MDSDDKKEKITAREIIAMTVEIKEHNFDKQERCFTCHEGREKPLPRLLFSGETAVKN